MQDFVGRLLTFDTMHVVIVVDVKTRDEIPVTDWEANGNIAPANRKKWNTGSNVFGFDITIEMENGERFVGWCADGDFALSFYDYVRASAIFGVYSVIFSDQSFMKEDGTPGVPPGVYYK